MLPVCSATSNCISHPQISIRAEFRHFPFYGNIPSYGKAFEDKSLEESGLSLSLFNGVSPRAISINRLATTSTDNLKFTENSYIFPAKEEFLDLTNLQTEISNILSKPANSPSVASVDFDPGDPVSMSNSLNVDSGSLSTKANINDLLNRANESVNELVSKGENTLKSTLDTIKSSITFAIRGTNETIDSSVNNAKVTVGHMGEFAANKFMGLFGDFNDASSKLGFTAVDVLRHTIIKVEDSLVQGTTFVFRGYESAKDLLPAEIHNVLDESEERLTVILRPVGAAVEQVFVVLGGLERSLGLDSDDPIVALVVLLSSLSALWISYWILTYGGYAGDLSPKTTLELLLGRENVALVDVRTEDMRDRDGVPDLRRAARFQYATVTPPEVDGSVRKLLKGGRDLDDTLIASIIQNLKIVQDRSKVIVMDADGTRSKGIARALQKLGVKRPYLVHGGFGSWMKEGLRVKELKPETPLSVLNEEAEAIIADINPSPLQVLGYGVGFIAAAYALLEWEQTLQLIGIFGIALTIYRRISSYEDSEDFKKDTRLLLAPVRLGGQAISWAAGRLEANRNGLPTSPSSSDVQNRVLQAAAKHESQPSDGEEKQALPPELMAPVNENVDLSEA